MNGKRIDRMPAGTGNPTCIQLDGNAIYSVEGTVNASKMQGVFFAFDYKGAGDFGYLAGGKGEMFAEKFKTPPSGGPYSVNVYSWSDEWKGAHGSKVRISVANNMPQLNCEDGTDNDYNDTVITFKKLQ